MYILTYTSKYLNVKINRKCEAIKNCFFYIYYIIVLRNSYKSTYASAFIQIKCEHKF